MTNRNISKILFLSEQLDFKIEQINGCRYFGPKRSHEKYALPEGCEVFVGRIPHDCFEDELFLFFSNVGPVYDIRVMLTFMGDTRGYGFVRYYNAETAKRAVAELNNCSIRPGFKLAVTKSSNHRTLILFSNKYAISTSILELEQVLKQMMVGLEKVEPAQNRQLGLSFFLHFTSHRAAALAKRNFTKEMLPGSWGWGPMVQLYWQPNAEVQDRLYKKKERKFYRLKQEFLQKYETALLSNVTGDDESKGNLPLPLTIPSTSNSQIPVAGPTSQQPWEHLHNENQLSAIVPSTSKYQIVIPEQSNTEHGASYLTRDNSTTTFGSKNTQPVAPTSYFQVNPTEGTPKPKGGFYLPLTVSNTSYQIPTAAQNVLQHWELLPKENLPSTFVPSTHNYQIVRPEQSNTEHWDVKQNPFLLPYVASNVARGQAPEPKENIVSGDFKQNPLLLPYVASNVARAQAPEPKENIVSGDFKQNPLLLSFVASNMASGHAPEPNDNIVKSWEYESKENFSLLQLEAPFLTGDNSATAFDIKHTQPYAHTSYFKVNQTEEFSIPVEREHFPTSPRAVRGTGELVKSLKNLRF